MVRAAAGSAVVVRRVVGAVAGVVALRARDDEVEHHPLLPVADDAAPPLRGRADHAEVEHGGLTGV